MAASMTQARSMTKSTLPRGYPVRSPLCCALGEEGGATPHPHNFEGGFVKPEEQRSEPGREAPRAVDSSEKPRLDGVEGFSEVHAKDPEVG